MAVHSMGDFEMNYSKWIKKGIHKPGKSAPGLAEAITKALKLEKPMHRITVYKMIAGTRTVYSEELAPIANYIGEPVPNLPSQNLLTDIVPIKIVREIGAGLWFEPGVSGLSDLGTIVVPKDYQFPDAKLTAYVCKGDSMAGVGIIDGDVIICIPPPDGKVDNGMVVIERDRAGLIELSARVVTKYSDRTEYICAGGSYKPVVVYNNKKLNHQHSENETVKVVAIIRRVTRNIP